MTFAHDMARANGIEPTPAFIRFCSMHLPMQRGPWLDRIIAVLRAWKALQ